ncbi:MAG: DNA topoisomerase VI subunit B [Thermoplasmata archaeon]|nr:DNA topoisomerase VI subunit B [Thermoplasmata archaeon]
MRKPKLSIAEELAKKQKEISVAEFFEKNRQILGFDNPNRALLTAVKEAVDNSLDACEEAGILPEITVRISKKTEEVYNLIVEDNGPGIVKKQIPNVFARLLYGSRFHAMRQSRGQQGIGISAAVLYAQLTTGKPAKVMSKVAEEDAAHVMELKIDTKQNLPEILTKDMVIWDREHGTSVELEMKGRYFRGRQSVMEYLRNTAIVNPHAKITLIEPDGNMVVFERASQEMPPQAKEIKVHPYGLEVGILSKIVKETEKKTMMEFLVSEFSSVSKRVAEEVLAKTGISGEREVKTLTQEEMEALIAAFGKVKLMPPSSECLSPIGEKLIRKGLKNVLGTLRPAFYAPPVTRPPAVYQGNPFIVEVGMVYGGEIPADQPVQILRFANRVPLLFQQGSCVCTLAVERVDWRRYGLEQRGGKGLPVGPAIILIHVCSTKVPFTSEAKEAIADIPEISREIELALMQCGRRLKTHLSKSARKQKSMEKFRIIREILPRIAEKSARMLGKPVPPLEPVITKIMDVVHVEENFVSKGGEAEIKLTVTNYMSQPKTFSVYTEIEEGKLIPESAEPKISENMENVKIGWLIKALPPARSTEIRFRVTDVSEDFEGFDYFISGIDAVHVLGAEALPGDWDIKMDFMPVDVEVVEEEEEGEQEEPVEDEEES